MQTITKEELLSGNGHSLTMKDLRRFVKENPQIKDEAPVLVERIKDFYFDKGSWKVYLLEGYWYYSMLQRNQSMQREIERRKNGEESQYPGIEDPEKHIIKVEDFDDLKDQFFEGWCISKEKDDSTVLIYNHY
jgi:hypothetical protein